MKEYYGNYVGVVITGGEKDPEHRGRCQVFVPNVMPTLYKEWNQTGEDISFEVIGQGLDGELNPQIVERLRQILPWAECVAPIIGASPSYKGTVSGFVSETLRNVGKAATETASQIANTIQEKLFGPSNVPTNPEDLAGIQAMSNEIAKAKYANGRCGPAVAESVLQEMYGYTDAEIRAAAGESGRRDGKAFNNVLSQFKWTPVKIDKPEDAPPGAIISYDAVEGNEYGHVETVGVDERGQKVYLFGLGNVTKPGGGSRVMERNLKGFKGVCWVPPADKMAEAMKKLGRAPYSQSASTPTENPSYDPSLSVTNMTSDPTKELELAGAYSEQLSQQQSLSLSSGASTDLNTSGTLAGSFGGGVQTNPTGNSKLAADRQARFSNDLKNPAVLQRLSYLAWQEVDRSGSATAATGTKLEQQANFIETVVNRAHFSGRNLTEVLNESGYGFGPGMSQINPTTQKAFEAVIAGRNNTNLATDNASNQLKKDGTPNPVARNRIDANVTGDWYENGVRITDPARIAELRSKDETPNGVEFLYRANGQKGYHSSAGLNADKYAKENGIDAGYITASTDSTIQNPTPHQGIAGPNTNNQALGMFGYASEGQAVWVFFREGNPLFPAYFGASYGSKEWGGIYQNASNALGSGNPGTEKQQWNLLGGTINSVAATDESSTGAGFSLQLSHKNGSNFTFTDNHTQFNSIYDHVQRILGDSHDIVEVNKEVRVRGDYNTYAEQDVMITVGNWSKEAMDASDEIQKILNEAMEIKAAAGKS